MEGRRWNQRGNARFEGMSVRKRRMHRLLAADASIDRSRYAYIYTPWRLHGRGQFLSDYSIHQFTISSEKTVGRASFSSIHVQTKLQVCAIIR